MVVSDAFFDLSIRNPERSFTRGSYAEDRVCGDRGLSTRTFGKPWCSVVEFASVERGQLEDEELNVSPHTALCRSASAVSNDSVAFAAWSLLFEVEV
jgi:hypothetical protein